MGLVTVATALLVATMSPQEKAASLVVSGLPAPPGVGGVIVQQWSRGLPRPAGALVFVDQEGGLVRAFAELPPAQTAAEMRTAAEALAAGRATGRALRRVGVHVDLAPVLDARGGPLGARHFRSPSIGIAFARGLARAGVAACAKHFPGLGTAAVSTDHRPRVSARLNRAEVDGFVKAIRAGIPCVMVSHAFYGTPFRASLESWTYRLLRAKGFDGVVITDSLSIVRRPPSYWPVRAVRVGADLLLFTSSRHAREAIRALIPLARRGELDAHVARVLRFRRDLG